MYKRFLGTSEHTITKHFDSTPFKEHCSSFIEKSSQLIVSLQDNKICSLDDLENWHRMVLITEHLTYFALRVVLEVVVKYKFAGAGK